jgi:16S rRNA processing protein RimM
LKSSNKPGADFSQTLIAIGEIERPHALRGLVKVRSLTDWPERFKKLSSVKGLRHGRIERELQIEEAIVRRNGLMIKFFGIDDRTAAETLTGMTLVIPRSECLSLPAGEFYTFEIIGLKVVNPQGAEIGVLMDVIDYPANDVWLIRKDGKDVLIPATQEFIKEVNPAAGFIVVDRIEEFEE